MKDKAINSSEALSGSNSSGLLKSEACDIDCKEWEDGSSYIGSWKDNEMHGEGKYNWPDGSNYEGEWVENKMHGIGKYCWPDGSNYEGEWVNGNRQGKGKYLKNNGDSYEGDWHKNKKDGWGVYKWGSGSVYEGSWNNNVRYGEGSFIKADGIYYLGLWDNDKLLKKINEADLTKDLSLFKRFKAKKRELVDLVVKERNIRCLIHFTRAENLNSIIEHGLVPVSEHSEYLIESVLNDELRIDSYLNATSCSIEFPNYRLFYYYRANKYCNTDWVVIKINPDILMFDNNIVYYCQTNAANLSGRSLGISVKSFEDMFSETLTTKSGIKVNRHDLNIPDNYTTDPQAEILIEGIIKPEYLYSVSFENESVILRNGIHANSFPGHVKLEINAALFKPRDDYYFWQPSY